MVVRNLERGSRVCHGSPSGALPLGCEVEGGAWYVHAQQNPEALEAFKQTSATIARLLKQYAAIEQPKYQRLRYFAQDYSRFGLKTTVGRLITSLGVKPLGSWQWQFKAFWLYGAVEPTTGEQLFLQFTHKGSECYQLFLDQFANAYPETLNILQVDNGAFHKAKELVVPDNVILLKSAALFTRIKSN